MSEVGQVKPGSSKTIKSEERDESVGDQGAGSENFIQDQVIIAPEIMQLILEQLDLRSLKKVRLVCKSWLREAQAHFEMRGVVRLHTKFSSTRIQDFVELYQETSLDLPQPFKSINVSLSSNSLDLRSNELLMSQLSSLLCQNPQLVITRLSPFNIPLEFALPLILQCSLSLEYLHLLASSCGPWFSLALGSKQEFPKLRHLKVAAGAAGWGNPSWYPNNDDIVRFASIVAWIFKGSRNLEIYQSRSNRNDSSPESASQLLLKLDLKNIKTLDLQCYYVNRAALIHFLSTPFVKLENLSLVFVMGWNRGEFMRSRAIIATARKAAATLRTLDLSCVEAEVQDLAQIEFPICPNVQELTLTKLPYMNDFVSMHFPSIQVLNAGELEIVLGVDRIFPPILSLKTLRVQEIKITSYAWGEVDSVMNGTNEVKFFEKFPSLERLGLQASCIVACCEVISRGGPQFSNNLEYVKHLEIIGPDIHITPEPLADVEDDWDTDSTTNLSSLAVLKGLETITLMDFDRAISTVPVGDLPCLKAIYFPWALDSRRVVMDKLLEIARGVEKVVVTNCCSIPRVGDQGSKELLQTFFDLAPNAECGCKERIWAQRNLFN